MLVNLKTIMSVAEQNRFAVPAFNISSNMLLSAVISACEESQSPVIIGIHPDELSLVGDSFIPMVQDVASQTSIPICIHLDHGSSFEQVMHAISCGYNSVMIDASTLSFEENVKITKKVVEAAHFAGVTVEGELGTIGTTGNGGEGGTDDIIFTDPDAAAQFVSETGVDALAIAIGTAHGLYPNGVQPALRFDLLRLIRQKTNVPLVLHGGSDNPDDEIKQAIQLGVSKINISSDIKKAFYVQCRKILKDETLREPNVIYPSCIDESKKVALQKMHLFGSSNKIKCYL